MVTPDTIFASNTSALPISEIAAELDMESGKVTELRRIAQDPLSLETPLGEFGLDARSPQLVPDEAKQQHAERNQHLSRPSDEPSPAA